MLECKYSHLLDPRLYACADVARFLDALNQPEIETSSRAAVQHFIDHMPALDDLLDHVTAVENRAKASLERGSLRPYATILSPKGEIIYNIHLTKRNPGSIERDVITTCKALSFTNIAYCTLLVQYEDLLDRIRITGDCIRGSFIQATMDISLRFGDLRWETHRDIGHRAKPYDRCRFSEIKDCHEMLDILKKTLMLSRLSSVENLPCWTEYDVLLNFAISMKAITAFSR